MIWFLLLALAIPLVVLAWMLYRICKDLPEPRE